VHGTPIYDNGLCNQLNPGATEATTASFRPPCRQQAYREFPALRFIVPVVIPFVAGSAPSGEKWKHPLIYLNISHMGRIRDAEPVSCWVSGFQTMVRGTGVGLRQINMFSGNLYEIWL
jgi:hypothetical protein